MIERCPVLTIKIMCLSYIIFRSHKHVSKVQQRISGIRHLIRNIYVQSTEEDKHLRKYLTHR